MEIGLHEILELKGELMDTLVRSEHCHTNKSDYQFRKKYQKDVQKGPLSSLLFIRCFIHLSKAIYLQS